MSSFEEREQRRKKSLISSMIDDASSEAKENESGATPPVQSLIVAKQKPERRSKRANFLMRPSVYEKAQKKCDDMGISLNECLNQFLEMWVES